jgi:hypothetical protein
MVYICHPQNASGGLKNLLKFTGRFGYGIKKIIRISYQKAHHFPASCVLCKFLRFVEKKKYI